MVKHNEKWVKTVSLEEFLKHQEHHKDDTDLKADYERITGAVEKPKKSKATPAGGGEE